MILEATRTKVLRTLAVSGFQWRCVNSNYLHNLSMIKIFSSSFLALGVNLLLFELFAVMAEQQLVEIVATHAPVHLV